MSKAALSIAKLARMRIIALPLTSEASSSGLHTYYHFQMPPSAKSKANPSLLKKTTEKAAALWAGFGKAPEGSWKHRTFAFGERMIERIEFEEMSLKSMDPSLGPKLSSFGKSEVEIKEKKVDASIPLIYPSFYERTSHPLQHLRALLEKRTPKHRKGCYLWLAVSPLTAPFMLVPIIPNLPFFFCLWRSWHHYRAFKASAYLESLIQNGAVRIEPNTELDKIYEKHRQLTPTSDTEPNIDSDTRSSSPSEDEARILLRKETIPEIISLFELPASAATDLYRALDQMEHRLRKA